MSPLLSGLLPLVGLVVGAVLQYLSSRSVESRKHAQQLRTQAYVDYLRAIRDAAFARTAEERYNALAEVTDAKARIAVYGSKEVVSALAAFDRAGPSFDNPLSISRFVEAVARMREKTGDTTLDDLRVILVGDGSRLPQSEERTGKDP